MHHRSIYTGCDLVKLQPGTKRSMRGSPPGSVDHPGNLAAANGTGGLVVVDIDGKNGGTPDQLFRAIPGTRDPKTRVVATASADSYHLVFRLPDGFKARSGFKLVGAGVEVPAWYTLPGSAVEGVTYRVVEDSPVADAPADLLPLLEQATVAVDRGEPAPGVSGEASALLRKLSAAPPGQRNATYLEVAFPVLGILGADAGALELELAWPGEESEIQHKLNSTIKALDPEHTSIRRVSRAREARTREALSRAVFGPFRGKPGTVQRRVFHAIAARCYRLNELSVHYASGTIAVDTGTYPHRVADALLALEEAGLIVSTPGGWRTLVAPEQPEQYPVPPEDSELLNPNHPVWLSEGLAGRHSQVFAYHLAGEVSATRIARATGVSRSTISECRKDLDPVLSGAADLNALEISGNTRRERVREYVSGALERLEALELEREQSTTAVSIPGDPYSQRALEDQALAEQA